MKRGSYQELEEKHIGAIKSHIKDRFKVEQSKHVEDVHVHVGKKVSIHRPEGSLQLLTKKEAGEDISIKHKLRKSIGDISANFSVRMATGIVGLDPIISGGFRKESMNLVIGGPGSGKSIFAMQFLITGIEEYDEPGIYISFEETAEEILANMDCFGWKLKEKIENNKLTILAYTPSQIEKILLEGGGILESVIKETNPKRIVFDSLSAFTMLHKEGLAQRTGCMSLFQNIKRWGCTALLVAEHETNPDEHNPETEEFEADSVILLYSIRKGNIRTRALEVLKMRSTSYPLQIFPMTISNEGISVHRDKLVF